MSGAAGIDETKVAEMIERGKHSKQDSATETVAETVAETETEIDIDIQCSCGHKKAMKKKPHGIDSAHDKTCNLCFVGLDKRKYYKCESCECGIFYCLQCALHEFYEMQIHSVEIYTDNNYSLIILGNVSLAMVLIADSWGPYGYLILLIVFLIWALWLCCSDCVYRCSDTSKTDQSDRIVTDTTALAKYLAYLGIKNEYYFIPKGYIGFFGLAVLCCCCLRPLMRETWDLCDAPAIKNDLDEVTGYNFSNYHLCCRWFDNQFLILWGCFLGISVAGMRNIKQHKKGEAVFAKLQEKYKENSYKQQLDIIKKRADVLLSPLNSKKVGFGPTRCRKIFICCSCKQMYWNSITNSYYWMERFTFCSILLYSALASIAPLIVYESHQEYHAEKNEYDHDDSVFNEDGIDAANVFLIVMYCVISWISLMFLATTLERVQSVYQNAYEIVKLLSKNAEYAEWNNVKDIQLWWDVRSYYIKYKIPMYYELCFPIYVSALIAMILTTIWNLITLLTYQQPRDIEFEDSDSVAGEIGYSFIVLVGYINHNLLAFMASFFFIVVSLVFVSASIKPYNSLSEHIKMITTKIIDMQFENFTLDNKKGNKNEEAIFKSVEAQSEIELVLRSYNYVQLQDNDDVDYKKKKKNNTEMIEMAEKLIEEMQKENFGPKVCGMTLNWASVQIFRGYGMSIIIAVVGKLIYDSVKEG